MATGLKGIFLKLILIGVMFLSMMSFVIITQIDNNTEFLITNNTLINKSYGDLINNLGSTTLTEAEIAEDTFGQITPTSPLGLVEITSIVSPTRIIQDLIIGIYNILIALPAQFLGIPEIIIAVINAILVVLLILGIWAIWKVGVNN